MSKHTGIKLEKSKHFFPCPQCGKVLNSKYNLQQHIMLKHENHKPFSCDVCNKKFSLQFYLNSHMKIHTKEMPFTCSYCNKSFARKVALKNHEMQHTNEKPFACDECNKGFPNRSELNRHKLSHSKQFKCDICSKHFSLKSTLKMHTMVHEGNKPYACEKCGLKHVNRSNLNKHMRLSHPDDKPFSCDKCGKSFKETEFLAKHIKKKHEFKLGKQLPCELCEMTFPTKTELQSHLKNHKGLKTFMCHKCGKNFPHKGALRAHFKTHKKKTSSYCCESCGLALKSKQGLKRHLKIMHDIEIPADNGVEEESDHKSDEESLEELEEEEEKTEKLPKPEVRITCEICNKVLKAKCSFVKHMKLHNGIKPYSCTYCSKTFIIESYLKRHLMVHTGERPYSCDICDKRFIRKDNLIIHKVKVHGIKKDVSDTEHIKPICPPKGSLDIKTAVKESLEDAYDHEDTQLNGENILDLFDIKIEKTDGPPFIRKEYLEKPSANGYDPNKTIKKESGLEMDCENIEEDPLLNRDHSKQNIKSEPNDLIDKT
eukprot:TRINITY_DN5243_c0_g1_i1.p1 TRINITY_DN5243_c0_g1~~TRINITY_DN5243_c0_g1_i1.p1  ORF type:complete len:541 (-),score=41.31 TRINITY_DN5243_c0_g1_i1:320-1942(-)